VSVGGAIGYEKTYHIKAMLISQMLIKLIQYQLTRIPSIFLARL